MKIRTVAIIICILYVACTKKEVTVTASKDANQAAQLITTPGRHRIGEHFGGGVVFYITDSGRHGLIADTADLEQVAWWNGRNMKTGATGTAIGTGRSNTNRIVAKQGDSAKYAALECYNYTGSGYTDWFLPSKDELNELYKQQEIVGGFYGIHYYSSSEVDRLHVWDEQFACGCQYEETKVDNCGVRAIRAF